MISFIKGKVVGSYKDCIIVENNGIGYKIHVSQTTMMKVKNKEEDVQIFTHQQVRQDDISLFGFLSVEELNMFEMLITVSGVGSKVALAILQQLTPTEIVLAIVSSDLGTLTKTKGLGKKTAERLALELRDKMKEISFADVESMDGEHQTTVSDILAITDSIDALVVLGYTKKEATTTVSSVYSDGMTTEEVIKASLKILARF